MVGLMGNVREMKKPDALLKASASGLMASGDLGSDLFELLAGQHVGERPLTPKLCHQQPIAGVNAVGLKVVPKLDRAPGRL